MKLYSVGAGGVGQLGLADTKDQNKPTPLEMGNRWKKVACGGYHNLAMTSQGQLCAWGSGMYGQLGLGKNVQKQLIPRPIIILENEVSISKIACGWNHTVILSKEGDVLSWGGDTGDFGLHRVGGFPKDVVIKKVAAGTSFTTAISGDGQVFAWGSGVDGRLGVGNVKNYRNPQKVNFDIPVRVVSIALGKAHALAVTEQGHVFSWGCGSKGQLGLGDESSHMTPVSIPGLSNIRRVRAGEAHSVALSDKGLVYTWGDGEHGQLGLGNSKQELSPCHVTGLPDEVLIVGISAGQWHTMAITVYGDLFAWGNNAFGQLALGHLNSVNIPEFVDTMPERKFVIQAVGGEKHSVFLIADVNLLENKGKKLTAPVPAAAPTKPTSPPRSPLISRSSPGQQAKRRSWRMSANSFENAFADIDKDLEAFEGEAEEMEKELAAAEENAGGGYQENAVASYEENAGAAIVHTTPENKDESLKNVLTPVGEDKGLIAKEETKERKCPCTIL